MLNLFFNKNQKLAQYDSILCNGRIFNDPGDIVNIFNDYFVNVGGLIARSINSDKNIHKYKTIHSNTKSLYFRSITPAEIYTIICSLSDCKGVGPDKINNSVIKSRAGFFSDLLSSIFN